MPPALPEPDALADRLRANRTDGAAVLAMLREYAGAAGSEDGPNIRRCAESLRDARPSMGAVGRILQYWIDTLPPDDASAGESAVTHCDAVSSLADAALNPHIAPGAVMIAEDFRPVRVLATESLVGLRLREHVRAQGEKTGEGAASVLSSGDHAGFGR